MEMKVVMMFIAIVVLLLVISCNPAPKSSGVTLTINGTEVSSVPWADGGVGTKIVHDFGVNESSTREEQEASLYGGPWYIWSTGQEELIIDYSDFPGAWDTQEQGMYYCKQSESMGANGNIQITLTKLERAKIGKSEENRLVYYRSDLFFDAPDDFSLFMMVSTPYIGGTFLVFRDLVLVVP